MNFQRKNIKNNIFYEITDKDFLHFTKKQLFFQALTIVQIILETMLIKNNKNHMLL